MAQDPRTVVGYVLAALALAAMLVLAPFILASGLVAPGWAVVGFAVVWLRCSSWAAAGSGAKPLWVIPLPFVAAAIWLGGLSAGGAWLGWTP